MFSLGSLLKDDGSRPTFHSSDTYSKQEWL